MGTTEPIEKKCIVCKSKLSQEDVRVIECHQRCALLLLTRLPQVVSSSDHDSVPATPSNIDPSFFLEGSLEEAAAALYAYIIQQDVCDEIRACDDGDGYYDDMSSRSRDFDHLLSALSRLLLIHLERLGKCGND